VRIFGPLYERVIAWSQHPRAPTLLGALSFVEAIVFPVPPEVMLAPMTLARPARWAWFASVSLFWSTLGAFVGYAVGAYAIDLALPLIERLGLLPKYEEVKVAAAQNGFWFLLVGGFVPIPFKLLTIASGAVGMPLLPFLAGALVGRGKRVYLVAGLIRLGGDRAEQWIHRYVEPIGYAVVLVLVALVLIAKFWH
jgi:membrane protein YqaA with SNARE-associated domain